MTLRSRVLETLAIDEPEDGGEVEELAVPLSAVPVLEVTALDFCSDTLPPLFFRGDACVQIPPLRSRSSEFPDEPDFGAKTG